MASDNRIDDEIETRLAGALAAAKKLAYQSVMALPEVGRIANELGRERRLMVISSDSYIPPKLANDLFMNQPNKNNFIVVNGSPTEFANVEKCVRRIYAHQGSPHTHQRPSRRRADEAEPLRVRPQCANAFDARWRNTTTGASMSPAEREWQRGWQTCTEVLSRRDVQTVMEEGW
jgi:hypothetical protein